MAPDPKSDHWQGELDLHIEVPDDLWAVADDSSHLPLIDDAFDVLLSAPPLLHSITVNQESVEVLTRRFPKSMASGKLLNDRSDIWWDVSCW